MRTRRLRKKVLYIGIDGCRHDALVAAQTPHIDGLVERGTRFVGTEILSPNRTDDANTVSGPGWSNLLTGVWPDKHGVGSNRFLFPKYKDYPHFFQRAKTAKPELKTASYSDWGSDCGEDSARFRCHRESARRRNGGVHQQGC